MKRYSSHILSTLILITICVVAFHGTALAAGAAQGTGSGGFIPGLSMIGAFAAGAILTPFGMLVQLLLSIAGFFLSISAAILNVSINLTTNLGLFINNTPAIYTTWQVLRDISTMFLIFVILWEAMKTILDMKSANYGTTLKNIVIVGILINFSFFFTTVAIDASNLVSLQLYNAIAPQSGTCKNGTGQQFLASCANSIINQNNGGIADVMMDSLAVTQWSDNKGQLKAGSADTSDSSVSKELRLVLINAMAVLITLLTSLSFLAAAAAAIWRICVLIMLLTFSPLWIVGYALPQIKSEVSDKWVKYLKSNLVFLPVYLLLMYVVLTIMQKMNFPNLGTVNNLGEPPAPLHWFTPFVQLGVGYAIVFFMINLPLVTALSISGGGDDILKKVTVGFRDWGAKRLKGMSSSAAGSAWMYTGGRAASALARSEGLKDFAGNFAIGGLALKGVRGVAGKYEKKLDSQVKSRTEFADSLGVDQGRLNEAQSELRTVQRNLASARAAGTPTDMLEIALRGAKMKVTNIENSRRDAYSQRVGQRTFGVLGTPETLFTKIARKDKVAAAKIQTPIAEKRVTQAKDNLKDIRDDIKQLKNAIRNNPVVKSSDPKVPPIVAGTPTAAQATRLAELQSSEVDGLFKLNNYETQLDTLKQVK